MKRRSFFGALFGTAAVPLAAAVVTAPVQQDEDGVDWQPKCPVCKKQAPVPIFVSLQKPVGPGIQYPFCLSVYDTTTLAQLIRDYNLRKGRNA